MSFTPRLTAPSNDDLHWIHTSHGGYNRCIIINSSTGSVIPNCVGYAWGRFLEENGLTSCNLSTSNAENWYSHVDEYARGQEPKLGAVICFEGVGSKAGHVAVVEEINQDGSIVTSNSAYGGTRFYTQTLYPPSYNMGSGYIFQGFIYPPNVTPDPPTPTPTDDNKHRFKWVLYSRKIRERTQIK